MSLNAGRVRPDDLPVSLAPLIKIGVPIALPGNVCALHDDFELRRIPDDRRIPVKPDGNRVGLPEEVVDLTRGDAPEVLFLREDAAAGLIS
jgi:hypothetical protein